MSEQDETVEFLGLMADCIEMLFLASDQHGLSDEITCAKAGEYCVEIRSYLKSASILRGRHLPNAETRDEFGDLIDLLRKWATDIECE